MAILFKGKTSIGDVREQGAEEDKWGEEEGNNRRLEKAVP
jgi:hypothetical protein